MSPGATALPLAAATGSATDPLNGTLPIHAPEQPAETDDTRNHPIYGTTIYIGRGSIDTVFGQFEVLTFQDLIHKGYILALVHGNLTKNELVYTRLHSSCVTSETLGSLDCDCVQQLNGALEVISKKPCGILFYLIQEGRGCGYVGKSRGCMLVQYHNDEISTFEAYSRMGMQKDYRTYRSITDICHILAIKPRFVLLTNNPDKIEGLRSQGMDVAGVEAIEITPNPWNQHYLMSKQQSGHLLMLVKNKVQSYTLPMPPCEPFAPYSIIEAPRFVHAASYYLPIKPTRSILTFEEYAGLGENLPYELSHNGEVLVDVNDPSLLDKHAILRRPFWFKVNIYYDIQTSSDMVVLEYNNCKTSARPPLVRIHSESIFSRFPLTKLTYKRKYHDSALAIVKNGAGMIILMYHDGRGFGLGKYVIASEVASRKRGFRDLDVDEQDKNREDGRDFAGAGILLKHHSDGRPYVMMYSNQISRRLYETHFPNVSDWKWIGDVDDTYGHQLLKRRQMMITHLLAEPNNSIRILKPNEPKAPSYVVTGIGSSEAHARFLIEQLKLINVAAKFVPIATPVSELGPNDKVIVFSQGMSPHTHDYVARADVLFTSVSETNKDSTKVKLLKDAMGRGANVVWFPLEDEYEVLIRLTGPFFGYAAIMHWIGKPEAVPTGRDVAQWTLQTPPQIFVKTAAETGRLSILLPPSMMPYHQNLVSKWIEGLYFSPPFVNDYLSFVHGPFQAVANNTSSKIPHLLITTGVEPTQGVRETLGDDHPVWAVNVARDIFEVEIILNSLILELMNRLRINQRDWPGKLRQTKMYNERYN